MTTFNGELSTYDNMLRASDREETRELIDIAKHSLVNKTTNSTICGHLQPLECSNLHSLLATHFVSDFQTKREGDALVTTFVAEVVGQLLEYIHTQREREQKVLEFHEPAEMKLRLANCLGTLKEPHNLQQLLNDIQTTLHYCVRTGHPHFFNQLSTGLDVTSMIGEWITATVNTNMFTYEIAPTFVLMEDLLLSTLRNYVWNSPEGDGIFAPGGAISNFYALLIARHKRFPNARVDGLRNLPRLIVFTSEDAHFSVERAAEMAGLGLNSVMKIRCDDRGKMDVCELEEKISEAKANDWYPLMVVATAGTTVLGAFDPIEPIAQLCQKHSIWFHVDAAWGGGVLLSRKHRHLMTGVHHADSVTWNPHKIMCATLQCSAFLLKEKGLLESCNALSATYLYQKDKHYDTDYDTGDKAIQCGRHNDAFKLWLMFRAKGEAGFEAHVDRMFELSNYLYEKAKATEGYEMVMGQEPEYLNVCFWYVPSCLRAISDRNFEWNARLHRVAPRIKEQMMKSGTLMVGYQPMGEKPNFFRPILSNPAATQQDCDFLISEIVALGEAANV